MTAGFALAAQEHVEDRGGGEGMRHVLARLRHAEDGTEREALKQQLFGAAAAKVEAETEATAAAKLEAKGGRRLIDAALRAASAVEQN